MPDAGAGAHPFEAACGQQSCGSVGVFIADAALRKVSEGCDAGMRMEPETSEWLSVVVEEVKEYERFQKLAKVGRGHQACDRPVSLPASASDDAGRRALRRGKGHWKSSGFCREIYVRHGRPFLSC
jgi:hypothetical protein